MAIGDKIFLADKQTLDEANEKIGTNIDIAGTITIFSRLKQIYDYMVSVIPNSRAVKIDNLDTTISSRQASVLTSTHASMIDAAISTRASQASVDTKATQVSANTINTNVGSNADAASATGSVHAKLKDIKSDLGKFSFQPSACCVSSTIQKVFISSTEYTPPLAIGSNRILIDKFHAPYTGSIRFNVDYATATANGNIALYVLKNAPDNYSRVSDSTIGGRYYKNAVSLFSLPRGSTINDYDISTGNSSIHAYDSFSVYQISITNSSWLSTNFDLFVKSGDVVILIAWGGPKIRNFNVCYELF